MRKKERSNGFRVDYTKEEHATVTRRAAAAGISMHAYIVAMTVNGKLPKGVK